MNSMADVIAAATQLAEQKIMVGGKAINSRAMGAGERAGKKKQDAMESILVAVSTWRVARNPKLGGRVYEVQFVAFCGSKNKTSDYTRSMIAASMAAQFTHLLEGQTWGLKVAAAEFDSAADRTRMADAQSGLAIWEVRWWQQMPMERGDVVAALYRLHEMQMSSDIHGSLDDAPEMEGSTLPEYGDLNPEPEMP